MKFYLPIFAGFSGYTPRTYTLLEILKYHIDIKDVCFSKEACEKLCEQYTKTFKEAQKICEKVILEHKVKNYVPSNEYIENYY